MKKTSLHSLLDDIPFQLVRQDVRLFAQWEFFEHFFHRDEMEVRNAEYSIENSDDLLIAFVSLKWDPVCFVFEQQSMRMVENIY